MHCLVVPNVFDQHKDLYTIYILPAFFAPCFCFSPFSPFQGLVFFCVLSWGSAPRWALGCLGACRYAEAAAAKASTT